MKQPEDKFTLDAFDKRPRGRPRKANAKSGAQRQREYRLRRRCGLLDAPRYTVPYRSIFAASETLEDVVLRGEAERHAKRIKDIGAMREQLQLLEPIVRKLETKGILLPVNDIKFHRNALVVRETGDRSQLLLDALIGIGLEIVSQTNFHRHAEVLLKSGTLKLSVYLPFTTEEERQPCPSRPPAQKS